MLLSTLRRFLARPQEEMVVTNEELILRLAELAARFGLVLLFMAAPTGNDQSVVTRLCSFLQSLAGK